MKYSVFFLTVLLVLSSGVGLNHQPIMKNTPALRTTRRNRPLQLIPKIQLKGDVAQARKLMQRTKFKGFLINRGQNPDRSVKYYMASPSSAIGFSTSMIHLRKKMNGTNIYFSLTFPGSNKVEPQGIKPILTSTNYYLGMVRIGGVATYSEVWYYNLYKGIDLRYYLNSKGLKYEFVVRPGADAQQINIRASDNMRVSLLSGTQLGLLSGGTTLLSDSALQVYQQGKIIPAGFALHSINSYSFHISSYDKAAILTIDPLLLGFSTYLGGSDGDYANGVATDSSGNIYVTGYTLSSNFPTLNAYQKTSGGSYDGFLSKFSPTGSLLFSTYLGGSGGDFANGVATDSTGNAFIIGGTYSTNFPTLNAYHTTNTGGSDAFLSKFSPSGALLFSTYLGGSGDDYGYAAATDSSGNVYVTGETSSRIFPLLNAYQAYYGGSGDAFLSKFSSTGSLLFSTYLGGSGIDYANGVATDSSGNVYLTGSTSSTNFPTTLGAYQKTSGGSDDAFLTKMDLTPPSQVTGISATPISRSQINLKWKAATDNTAVKAYKVYRNGVFIKTVSGNFTDVGLHEATRYNYTVAAVDTAGNMGQMSLQVSTVTLDLTAPSLVTGLRTTAISGTQINLRWNASTDNVGVTGYKVYRDGVFITTVTTTNFTDSGLSEATTYSYTVEAGDAAGNLGQLSQVSSATTFDTMPPGQVNGVTAIAVSNSSVLLRWNATSDNIAVTGYKIYRDGVLVGTAKGELYLDTGLTPGGKYSYTVAAVDAAGNTGLKSTAISVQTPVPTRTPTQTPTPDQPFTTPQPSTTTNQSPTSTTKGGTPFPFLPLLLGMMLIVVWRRKIKRVFRFK